MPWSADGAALWVLGLVGAMGLIGAICWFAGALSSRDLPADETLRRRYARGEIGREQFERMINELYVRAGDDG